MKQLLLSALIAVGAVAALLIPAVSVAEASFVTRKQANLSLDGRTFYVHGTNQYYLFYRSQAMVDEVLQDAKALGLNTIRTWASCEGARQEGYCFQPQPRVYDEPTFQKLDYVLYKANQLGLRVILPLVNNWSEFGGMSQYVAWCGSTAGHDEFYRSPCAKALYKDYVRRVLTRVNIYTGVEYRNDPTILLWELANEPRCQSDRTGNTLLAWISEMAAFVKSIDPNHLLGTGEEGWYVNKGTDWRHNGFTGVDFIRNSQVPLIDVASFRLYPEEYGLSKSGALLWIDEHADDAHQRIGKPVTLGEFGWKVSRKIFGDFSTGLETWRVDWGYATPQRVASPSWNGNGALRYLPASKLPANGSAGGDRIFAAPGLDLRSYNVLSGWVYLPSTAPAGMRAALYTKSGPMWVWQQGTVSTLVRGGWTRLTMATSQSNQVLSVGIKVFNGPTDYTGPVYYDAVIAASTVPGKTLADRNRIYTDWYNRLNAKGVDGASFWILSGHQDNTAFFPDYDRYTVYVPEDDDTSLVIQRYSMITAGKNTGNDQLPVVAVRAPVSEATVSGGIPIKAMAIDDKSISAVAYAVDGGSRHTMVLTSGVWQANWDSLSAPDGPHTITVFATDSVGQVGQSQVPLTVRNR